MAGFEVSMWHHRCVVRLELNRDGNEMTEKEVETTETDRRRENGRLRELCGFYHAPQGSLSQIPGLVIPSPGYAAESPEEYVIKTGICGHQCLRISALAYVLKSRPKLHRPLRSLLVTVTIYIQIN